MGAIERLAATVLEMTGKLDALAERGLRGWVEELAVLHALQLQAQALIGMVMRLAAALGYAPETPTEAAKLLADEGVIGGEDLDFIRRVVEFRDITVHEYASVNMGIVKRILEAREYRRVTTLAAKMLERARKRNLDP